MSNENLPTKQKKVGKIKAAFGIITGKYNAIPHDQYKKLIKVYENQKEILEDKKTLRRKLKQLAEMNAENLQLKERLKGKQNELEKREKDIKGKEDQLKTLIDQYEARMKLYRESKGIPEKKPDVKVNIEKFFADKFKEIRERASSSDLSQEDIDKLVGEFLGTTAVAMKTLTKEEKETSINVLEQPKNFIFPIKTNFPIKDGLKRFPESLGIDINSPSFEMAYAAVKACSESIIELCKINAITLQPGNPLYEVARGYRLSSERNNSYVDVIKPSIQKKDNEAEMIAAFREMLESVYKCPQEKNFNYIFNAVDFNDLFKRLYLES